MAQHDLEARLLPDFRKAGTPERAAEMLGDALGLRGPAPLGATRRALADPDFARALLAVRNSPAVRDPMLADPGAARIAPRLASALPSSGKLLRKAAGSVLKWGMEGMKPAAPWVISRRLAACNACEFQAPAPETLVYRGARVVVGKDATICTACNCLINTKAAISTEMCPEQDPETPELSRWQEPWVPPEDHPKGPW